FFMLPHSTVLSLVCVATASAIQVACCQDYSVDWHKLASGGGNSVGGSYSLTGTIGQPDAGGAMTGGRFSLTGGFWALYAVQTPGAPLLRIALTATNTAVLAWSNSPAPFALQENPVLGSTNWLSVTNAPFLFGDENQVIVPAAPSSRFY